MSQDLELFHWWFDDKTTGQRRRTTCAMDRQTAIELYGDVQPDQPTRVVRTVYQLGEAPHAQMPPELQVVEVGNRPGSAPPL